MEAGGQREGDLKSKQLKTKDLEHRSLMISPSSHHPVKPPLSVYYLCVHLWVLRAHDRREWPGDSTAAAGTFPFTSARGCVTGFFVLFCFSRNKVCSTFGRGHSLGARDSLM